MIYAKDIQHLIEPAKWQVTPQKNLMHYDELIQNVQAQTKQKITFFMPEQAPNAAWQFRLANKHYASVNPYSGSVLNIYESTDTIYGFAMGLHRWLLFENSKGEKTFRNWMSVCALLLLINVLLGFYLWVKPKNRVKRLAIKPKAKFRVLMYQLHTVPVSYTHLTLPTICSV